jgi:hypothetical protein
MWDVLESVRDGAALPMPAEDESFLVLNPGYHDGKRASFLLLPAAFCQSMLLAPAGLRRQDVSPTPIGRILTVTDRGVVLSVMTSQRLAHWSCEATADFRELGGGTTMGSLDDAARAEGWLVPWVDFDAVMSAMARRSGLKTSYSQLMKRPLGSVVSKGGEG